MLCFEVLLNRKRVCLAGVGESGVLSTIVSWVGGSPQSPRKGGSTRAGEAHLHVGGLHNPEPHLNVHPRWVDERLKSGDEVTVRLVRASRPDVARHNLVQTHDEIRELQRRYYLEMKEEFENESGAASSVENTKAKSGKRKRSGPRAKKR